MPACFALPRVTLAALLAAQPAMAQTASTDSTDWRAAARAVVNRLALVRGERVLLVGVAGVADALVPELRAAIRAAGGTDVGAVSDRGTAAPSWSTDFTRDLASKTGPAFDEALRTVDAAVMMPGATPADRTYAGMQRVLQSGHSRTVHFHWAGAYDETGTLLPTTADVARFYLRALEETDYAALATKQRAFETAMRGKVIRVTTPAGTDIRFRIGDRTVTKQDGDASAARTKLARVLIDREIELPAGAIRVAPIEESVEGTIAFPPSMWGGTRVEGLMLAFAKGRVTEVRATTGRDAVEQEIAAAGDAGRSFREFALGLNPLLAIPTSGTRWIPYYGYGAGVVRLSLGDNTELGGNVRGGYVRWNFFIDATVTVGSDVWVRDGRLVR
jgi:leucyl aminopeptidase (aminopeptidase T)